MRKKVTILIVVILAFGLGYLSRPTVYIEREIDQVEEDLPIDIRKEIPSVITWQSTSATVTHKVIRGDRDGQHYEVVMDIPELDEEAKMRVSAIEYRIIGKEDIIDVMYIKDEVEGQVTFLQWVRDDDGRLNIHWDRPVAVVDAGHGGFELGEGSNELWVEKDMNLKMAEVMKIHLQDAGVHVIMTRNKDEYVGLYDRVTIANYVHADILVSNHLNRMDGKASGIEVLYSSHSDRTFAKALAASISTETHGVYRVYNRRGQYRGSDFYALHKYTEVPSYIIEYGFSDHEADSDYVMANWEVMAQRAAESIVNHLVKTSER